MEMMAAATRVFVAASSRTPRLLAGRGQDERELADLGQGDGDREGDPERVPRSRTIARAASGLPSRTTASVAGDERRGLEQVTRVEQHPDRDEEQDGEGVPHRQGLGRRPEAELRAADDHPGEERAEGHRHAEELRRADGDAQGHDEHGQREQLARPGGGHAVEQPGDEPLADEERQGDQRGELDHGEPDGQRRPRPPRPRPRPKTAGSSTSTRTVNRSSTTSQPTAMWPVGVCRSSLSARTRIRTTVLATEMARPKTMPADQPQPKATPTRAPSSGRDQALAHGAGHGDPPHGEQLLEVEVQADAEHQQDDADLGELVGQVLGWRRSPGVCGPTTKPASR